MAAANVDAHIARYADMFSAMGTEARLRIMRLLLSAHPDGMVVGDIGAELGIPASTLSHHLDKLKNEGLVGVRPKARFFAIQQTRKRCGRFWRFFTRNAAPATKLFGRKK